MGNKLCECGCGGVVNPGCRFLVGHNARIDMTLERRKKLSEARKGKSLAELGHKEDCVCFVCKMVRGEIKEHPFQRPEARERVRKIAVERNKNNNPMKNFVIAKKNGDAQKGNKRPDISLRMLGDKNPMKRPEIADKARPKYGKDNHNWQGGVSDDPYPPEWTERLREYIRNRDGRVCQVCNKTEQQNGKKLEVHHIDSDKDNCDPINLLSCV